MGRPEDELRGTAVPGTRISRLLHLGGLTAGIGGRMLRDGAREVISGRRPALPDLLLTPANARHIADQLARMRGAAMKLGQLISLDGGDVLPRELTEILSRLRADADHMPPAQLRSVLDRHWGKGWLQKFAKFDPRPVASASIGQVHRARTRDGRDLAIKVQYPGVRASIDSDVSNLAALMRLSGLVPKGFALDPLLDEARRQLHEEADYAREAAQMERFGALLQDAPGLIVPRLHQEFSGPDILAMDFIESLPIETLETAPQATRDDVTARLCDLTLRELFEFRLMQTDPNFANFRWQPETGRIVLLDFGATREIPEGVADGFTALLAAASGSRADLSAAAIGLGYFPAETEARHREALLDMMEVAMTPLRARGVFDFADTTIPDRVRDMGIAFGRERDFTHVPPMDILFLHRKFGGLYLLGRRLRARLDLLPILQRWAPPLSAAS